MLICICGKSGCGKTTLSNNLVKTNPKFIHLDIDKIGHNVLNIKEVQYELINTFGNNIIKNGITNRKLLSSIVFNSSSSMDSLTNITWKYMEKEIDNFILIHKDKIIILDWLLVIKTKYFDMCDIKILIDVPYEIRKERAIKRDNISSEAFDLRENSSINYDKEQFDIVINNNDDKIVKRLVKLV